MPTTRLKHHTNATKALAAVREAANGAANVIGGAAGQTPRDVHASYIRWLNGTARTQLRNFLADEFVDELLHTETYRRLQFAERTAPLLIPSVLAECDDRRRALDHLADVLAEEVHRWEGNGPLVVPDTSLFLQQNVTAEDIDWPTLAHTERGLRIVVPLVVIYELDRLKRQGNSTAAQAAHRSIRWFDGVLPTDPRSRSQPLAKSMATTVEVYVDSTPLDHDDKDLAIVLFARWLGQISSRSTRLVTRDLNMRLRANALGVDARYVPTPPPPTKSRRPRSGGSVAADHSATAEE